MEFFDVVSARRSIRAYEPRPVREDQLQQMLEAINCAPSAGNLQGYEIYVVRDPGLKAALVKAAGDQEFLMHAAVVLVVCTHAARSAGKYGSRGTDLYSVQDATIACTYGMLAATALGLSTVWVGAFTEDAVRGVIGAPGEHRPVAMLPVGFAAESPPRASRRSLEDLVHEVDKTG